MSITFWLVQSGVQLVGAAHSAAGRNAIRASRVPINFSRLKRLDVGFPDPAVSTGFLHQLLSALSNLFCALVRADLYAICGSRWRSPLAIIAQIMRAFL